MLEEFFILGFISCRNDLQSQTAFLGNGLTEYVHQVVLEVIVTLVLIGYRKHQAGCFHHFFRIVIVLRFRPSGSLPYIQSRTGTEQRFVRTLLRFFFRTVIDTSTQQLPSLLQGLIGCTVTGLYIFIQPFGTGKAFGTPREFVQQFVHHRIVLNTFRGNTNTLHRLGSTGIGLGIVEAINQDVHLAMQANVTTEVQQHAIRPVVLHETVLAAPFRPGIAPLRTAFGMKVEHEHIASLTVLYHRYTRIFLPGLNDPNSFGIALLHGIHHGLTGCIEVHTRGIAAFVEGVHGIELRLAIEFGQLLII